MGYMDFDAALEAAEPVVFKFMGERWELPVDAFDFRDFGRHNARMGELSDDDEAAGAEILGWLGAHCQDPARFSALAESHKLPLMLLIRIRQMIVEQLVGMEWAVGDLGDPLGLSSVSSAPLNGSGPPSAGNSRKSASKTR